MDNKKIYNNMEPILNEINRLFINLPEEEVKFNKKVMARILKTIICRMEETDILFKKMYRRIFYGGSYFDGLRIGSASEFDLDLLFYLPKALEPLLVTSDIPGFVYLQSNNYENFIKSPEASNYKGINKIFGKKYYLENGAVLRWMEKILQKCLHKIGTKTRDGQVINLKEGQFIINYCKSGPALTLNITQSDTKFNIDIDLVPCFVFGQDFWPKGFTENPVPSKPEFFIVPKAPKIERSKNPDRYWRLSFQEQERELMSNKITLKPTIKLLKKLRDKFNHNIASYYIKTVVMLLIAKKDDDFWTNSLSYVFITVLKDYEEYIRAKIIPYYWDENNNLIGNMHNDNATQISNKLLKMINDIETKHQSNPNIIAEYLLTTEEYNRF